METTGQHCTYRSGWPKVALCAVCIAGGEGITWVVCKVRRDENMHIAYEEERQQKIDQKDDRGSEVSSLEPALQTQALQVYSLKKFKKKLLISKI